MLIVDSFMFILFLPFSLLGFLKFSAIDIWGWKITFRVLWGEVLSRVPCRMFSVCAISTPQW